MLNKDDPDHQERRTDKSRDAAGWLHKAIVDQSALLDSTRMNIVVGQQQVDGKLDSLESKVDALHQGLLGAIPNGDPKLHLKTHERLEVEYQEGLERAAEEKRFRKDMINKIKASVIMGALAVFATLLSLGVFEQFRMLVHGVEQGKTADELRRSK